MPKNKRLPWPLAIGFGLAPGWLAATSPTDGKWLECRAESAAGPYAWQVRLDPARQLAVVDEKEIAAHFSASHVRIGLAEGQTLFIGRVSGRLVVSAADGATLAVGKCIARVEA